MARPSLIERVKQRPDIAALIVAVPLLIGLWSLGARKELWFDERFMVVMSGQPLSAMFSLLRFENNPPLPFIMLRGWIQAFSDSAVALRAFTLLPTLGTLVVIRLLANRLTTRGTAALATLLGGTAGLIVAQAGEVRMYPWLMLWSALATWLTWLAWRAPQRSILIWLAVVNVLGIYTHYTYALTAVYLFVWLMVRSRGRRRRVFVSFAASGVAFAPWFVVSVVPKLQDLTTNVGVQRITNGRWEMLLLPFRFLAPPYFLSGLIWLILRYLATGIVAASLLVFLGRLRGQASEERAAARYIGGLFLFGALALFASGLSAAKYASAFIPAAVVVVAWGLALVPLSAVVRRTMIGALLAVVISIAARHALLPYVAYARASGVAAREWRAGDRALVYPFNDYIVVNPSTGGAFAVQGFFPLQAPSDVTFDDVVRYNFRVTLDTQNVDRLAAYVGDARRVWFFYDVPPYPGYWRGDLIDRWFLGHGFRSTWYRDIFQNVPPLLIRYDREGA